MIPKKYRLGRFSWDLYGSAPKHYFSWGTIWYQPKSDPGVKIAIVVSKKVSKLAVTRNKVKRVVASLLLELIKPQNCDYTIIVSVKPSFLTTEKNTIKQDIQLFVNKCLKTS